jgi:hypothetical protein
MAHAYHGAICGRRLVYNDEGASPRIGHKSDRAPGRQKSLLFSRFLSPLQGSCPSLS